MTPAHGPAIAFDGVGLRLGQTSVLRDVSLRVVPGSVHALVGPNGAGKSSLIKTLLGQTPHQGRVALPRMYARCHRPGLPGAVQPGG